MSRTWEEDVEEEEGQLPRLDSRATPADGGVYTMYHGTSRAAAASILKTGFRPSSKGMLGPGVYLSRELQKAIKYPLELSDHDRIILKVRVEVGKVKAINYQGHDLQYTWHANGYDTAWCPPHCGMVKSGQEEDCVWDPKRVRVLGVFSPKSRPNRLWAEDDFDTSAEPKLESYKQPLDDNYYTMYHGTSRKAADSIMAGVRFRRSTGGMLGPGVYLSRDLQKASRYPLNLPLDERVVLKVTLNVGKVKKIDYQGHPMQKTWRSNGYDTAWCPPECGMVRSGLEEDCVSNPSRIKVRRIIPPNLDFLLV